MQRIKNIYHLLIAVLANIRYGFPARSMTIIGVTGTDGKTTTASLIYQLLSKNNKKVALLTSVSALIGGKSYDTGFHVTTPSPFMLQKFLAEARKAGAQYFILETTSHALDQHRVYGIPYKIGVITNVTHEHLDYHKTYEKYLRTKAKLLIRSKIAIINRDTDSYEKIITYLKHKKYKGKIVTYGFDKNARINLKNFSFKTHLIGEFNTYNTLAAISVGVQLGLEKKDIQNAVTTFTPPVGRQDVVYDKAFRVMIDFAHTPHSFEVILSELKKQTKGRLIHVFGAASKRDETKRPLMGEISSKYADFIILTSEDPRKENPMKIIEDIEKGIPKTKITASERTLDEVPSKAVARIEDRAEAIRFAVKLAKKGDIVVITGKSHEKTMNINGVETPWNEYEVVKQALQQVTNNK
jgi:UDP-N-acetylmuramoyl-L-alanyl-D-glutamate--2,6-diaminopimelate ligase